jgi:hypothetical protein
MSPSNGSAKSRQERLEQFIAALKADKSLQRTPCGLQRARVILDAKSDAAVYLKVARHELPCRKVGRKLYFFEEEIRAFIDRYEAEVGGF